MNDNPYMVDVNKSLAPNGAVRSRPSTRHYVSEHIFETEKLAGTPQSPFRGKPIPSELLLFDHDHDRSNLIAGNPVYTQGHNYKCVPYVGCTMREWQVYHYHQRQSSGGANERVTLSKDYVYDLRENRFTPGMSGADLMRVLVTYGCVLDSNYPEYMLRASEFASLEQQPPPQQASGNFASLAASINELIIHPPLSPAQGDVYAQVFTVDGLKEALVYNGPCCLVLPFYPDATSAQFWMPPNTGHPVAAIQMGHCVTIVGFSDAQQAFLARNQYGPLWNGTGHVWYPYQHLQNKWFWEIWTLFYNGRQYLQYHQQRQVNQQQPLLSGFGLDLGRPYIPGRKRAGAVRRKNPRSPKTKSKNRRSSQSAHTDFCSCHASQSQPEPQSKSSETKDSGERHTSYRFQTRNITNKAGKPVPKPLQMPQRVWNSLCSGRCVAP